MIVVDTSALLAIPEEEQDAAVCAKAIAEADPPLISAASVIEVEIVMLNRHGSRALRKVNGLIQEAGFQVEGVTAQHAHHALDAYATYGRGQKSKAGLNYGDCFSYALAKVTGLPLLFKSRDFQRPIYRLRCADRASRYGRPSNFRYNIDANSYMKAAIIAIIQGCLIDKAVPLPLVTPATGQICRHEQSRIVSDRTEFSIHVRHPRLLHGARLLVVGCEHCGPSCASLAVGFFAGTPPPPCASTGRADEDQMNTAGETWKRSARRRICSSVIPRLPFST